VVIGLERGADDLHVVQLMPLPPRHLLLHQNPNWFSHYPGCHGKEAVKRVSVCLKNSTNNFSSCDREPRPMTLTFQLDLDKVELNQRVKYLGQRSLISEVIVWTQARTHAHRHTPDRLLYWAPPIFGRAAITLGIGPHF